MEDRTLLAMFNTCKDKPALIEEIVNVLRNPPKIGSLKLSWRDGKLCNVETTKQTY